MSQKVSDGHQESLETIKGLVKELEVTDSAELTKTVEKLEDLMETFTGDQVSRVVQKLIKKAKAKADKAKEEERKRDAETAQAVKDAEAKAKANATAAKRVADKTAREEQRVAEARAKIEKHKADEAEVVARTAAETQAALDFEMRVDGMATAYLSGDNATLPEGSEKDIGALNELILRLQLEQLRCKDEPGKEANSTFAGSIVFNVSSSFD